MAGGDRLESKRKNGNLRSLKRRLCCIFKQPIPRSLLETIRLNLYKALKPPCNRQTLI